MNLAHPQPASMVTRVEGFLPRIKVTFDQPGTEPVNIHDRLVPTTEDFSLIDHLITEDDNPVDNIPSSKQQRLLVGALYSSWRTSETHRRFLADANIGMFYAMKEPPLVPDMFLSLNVQVADDWWKKENRSYFFWEFGKPPEVAIEIVSNREGGEDDRKLRDYARAGIRYYVIFDPHHQLGKTVLHSYELRGTKYVKMKKPWFPDVGLGLTQWIGTYEDKTDVWLRWCDKDGQVIPTGDENTEQQRQRADRECREKEMALLQAEQERREKETALLQAEQERQRTEQERQRTEQERREKEMALLQAERERQQKERLLAKLRALGIELEE